MDDIKDQKTDEGTMGRRSLNFAILGFGLMLLVLLTGAVVVMGSLLKQFIDGRGIGSRSLPDDYVLGTLLVREAPVDNEYSYSPVNDHMIQDISRTVLLASVKVKTYNQGGLPIADVTCFGVVMDESGYIITSVDVIRDESIIEVELYDGRKYMATVIGYDLKTDLCVLRIDGQNLRTASFGSGGMKEGDGCLYIGLGQREIPNISQGLLGASEGRYIMTEAGYSYLKLTATDRVVSDRCSGGVIVNYLGQIVGFRCAVADDSLNMLYALSVDDARGIIDDIIKHGYVNDRYTLGLFVESISEVVSRPKQWPVGLYVADLPALNRQPEESLMIGDIILSVSEESVDSVELFEQLLSQYTETVVVQIYRPIEDRYIEFELELIEDTGLYLH
ncbi:MAG: S1C family serine protease [Oscillospiraceae bacterium]|nr:S1C family serine protease [Oscillospiraceae bacterium]